MLEEEQKQKYKILITKIYKLKNDITEFNDCYNEMKASIKEGMIIDNKIPEEYTITKIEKNIKFIKNDLTKEVITRINNKI